MFTARQRHNVAFHHRSAPAGEQEGEKICDQSVKLTGSTDTAGRISRHVFRSEVSPVSPRHLLDGGRRIGRWGNRSRTGLFLLGETGSAPVWFLAPRAAQFNAFQMPIRSPAIKKEKKTTNNTIELSQSGRGVLRRSATRGFQRGQETDLPAAPLGSVVAPESSIGRSSFIHVTVCNTLKVTE